MQQQTNPDERELIDTLWNVNCLCQPLLGPMHRELIDTLWNVNISQTARQKILTTELIDTLWNVNKVETLSKIAGALGINRYIMECK